MKNKVWFTLFLLIPNLVFAIQKKGGVIAGFDKAEDYLEYAIYWSAVLGCLSVAFLLFKSHQESVLHNMARAIGVVAFCSLCFTIPTWFGLCISFN